MLDKLDALKDYMYYFRFTLDGYGADVEQNVPSKNKAVVPAFQRLPDLIGPDRVIWRYDPIFSAKPIQLTIISVTLRNWQNGFIHIQKMHDRFS